MFFAYGVGWSWVHVLITLTVDRFARVYLNIKYDIYITETVKKVVLCSCYVGGITLGVAAALVHLIISAEAAANIIRWAIFPTHGFLAVFSSVWTYTYIVYKISSKRSRPSCDEGPNGPMRFNLNHFVPFLYVLAYVLFVIAPNMIYVVLPYEVSEKYRSIMWRLVWSVYFTVDAVICILLNKPIRRRFWRNIKCKTSRVGDVT